MHSIYIIYLVRLNGKPVYVGFTSKTLEERKVFRYLLKPKQRYQPLILLVKKVGLYDH